MRKIKTIIKNPKDAVGTITEVEDKLENWQEIVGGWIETFPLRDDLLVICNEEGKINGLPYNVTLNGEMLVGSIAVIGGSNLDGDFEGVKIDLDEWREILDRGRA